MITLRQRLEANGPLPFDEAARLVAHLAREVEQPIDQGEAVFIVPGNIWIDQDGSVALGQMTGEPEDARDLAAFAPEQRSSLAPADRAAAIYGLGAVLYEALSGTAVSQPPRPIRELCPHAPEPLDHLFAAALQSDRSARPADLGALASALEQLAQSHGAEQPAISQEQALDPFAAVAAAEQPVIRSDATEELAQLKAKLESDPRPRYVVQKDGMDHGPFSAVELLQQIARHVFRGQHVLRDEVTGESQPIAEYPHFAPFAEHARMHRDVVHEKHAVMHAEKADKHAGFAKYLIGAGVLLVVATIGGVLVAKSRGKEQEHAKLADDTGVVAVEVEGGLTASKRAGGGGGGGGGFVGGMSYEAALARGQELNMGKGGGPELSRAQLEAPVKNGAFLNACGVPNSTKVEVRVAVQNGRAIGVTVVTNPSNPGQNSCIASRVRGMSWPSTPLMESFRTTF